MSQYEDQILLTIEQVCDTTQLGKTTVYKLMTYGNFPRPRRLSGRRVAWLYREVLEWVESCPMTDIADANVDEQSKIALEAQT